MVPGPRFIDTSSQNFHRSTARSPRKQDVEVIDLTGSLTADLAPKYGRNVIRQGSGSQSSLQRSAIVVSDCQSGLNMGSNGHTPASRPTDSSGCQQALAENLADHWDPPCKQFSASSNSQHNYPLTTNGTTKQRHSSPSARHSRHQTSSDRAHAMLPVVISDESDSFNSQEDPSSKQFPESSPRKGRDRMLDAPVSSAAEHPCVWRPNVTCSKALESMIACGSCRDDASSAKPFFSADGTIKTLRINSAKTLPCSRPTCLAFHDSRPMIPCIESLEANLRGHLTQLRKTQIYFVRNKLRQAREGGQLSKGAVAQSTSPFDGIPSIRCGDTSNKQNVGKFGHFVKGTNERSNALQSYSITAYKQEQQPVPPYTAYISAKRNVLTEDDKQRTFLPYHGDDFEVDDNDKEYAALETKIEKNKGRYHRLNGLHDRADLHRSHAENFLTDMGCSFEAVLCWLLDESAGEAPSALPVKYKAYWDLRTSYLGDGYYEEEEEDDHRSERERRRQEETTTTTPLARKPRRQWQQLRQQLPTTIKEYQLAAACLACKVFQDIAGFSLFHIVVHTLTLTPNPATSPSPFSLGTYSELGCFICKVHECPGHGEYHDSEESKNSRERVNFKPGSPDPEVNPSYKVGKVHVVDYLGLRDDGDVIGPAWTDFRKSYAVGLQDTDLCSDDCFWVKQARVVLETSDWSQADDEAFAMLRPAYEYERRGPCLIAQCGLIKRSCKEIFLKLVHEPSTFTMYSLKIRNERETAEYNLPPRRTIDQWFDDPASDRAWRQDTREPFLPCDHLGPCSKDTGCSCFAEGVHCEKSCGCSDACTRRFQGCRCHSRGRPCRTDRCDCRRLNRECDPDICTTCGSDQVLDLLNRHDEDVLAGKCENAFIQRGVPKRTLLAPSKLMADGGKSGWGLYMGEECKRGDFIGEYRGEIISDAEADQRGTIYDKRNMSYLFTLNGVQTLDSTLIGNKLRFINHQADPMANCYARLLLCHGVVRIGMFAQKDMAIGEEMFFNYGESFATKFDLIKMNPDGSVTVERPQKHSRPSETFKRRVHDARPLVHQLKNKAGKNGPPTTPVPESSAEASISRKRRASESSVEQSMLFLGSIEVQQPPESAEEKSWKRLRRTSPQAEPDDGDPVAIGRPRQTRSQLTKASTVSQSPASTPSKQQKQWEPNIPPEPAAVNTRSSTRSKATVVIINLLQRPPPSDMPSEIDEIEEIEEMEEEKEEQKEGREGREEAEYQYSSTGQEPSEDEEDDDDDDDDIVEEEEEEEEEEDTTPRRSSRRRSEKHHFEGVRSLTVDIHKSATTAKDNNDDAR